MTRRLLLATALRCAFAVMARAQTPATAVQPNAVTRTIYSKNITQDKDHCESKGKILDESILVNARIEEAGRFAQMWSLGAVSTLGARSTSTSA